MDSRARALWLRTEPLHAVTYFDEHCRGLGRALGLSGFWMGYFAARTAPLGPVPAPVAGAALAVFAPDMVARALPAAWSVPGVTPERVVDERAVRAAAALRAVAPGIAATAPQLLGPLAAMVADAPAIARPLFAANQALPERADPVEQLWQLTTSLREFRGDAHAAALADHDLDGCAALVLAAATDRVPKDGIRLDRGWSEEEWAVAVDALRSRRLLDTDGHVTDLGRTERAHVEDTTDRLAGRLLRPLTDRAADQLLAALKEPAGRVTEANVLPFPNPIGLPRPRVVEPAR
ncbi:hypothetical protein [Streptomyces sp. KL116D]|uniref:SCO6745 family protein n=1 Tax=Streptomyces sp. KL116D TaxID=3045152 RepID=UPI0035571534